MPIRRFFRRLFRRRRFPGRRPAVLLLVVVAGFFLLLFYALDFNLRPVFVELAKGMARRLAADAINQALIQTLERDVDYNRLVSLHTDRNGRILGATLNEREVLRLQTDVTARVQSVVDRLSTQKIEIPIGQAMNSSIFSAFGPMVPVTVIPFGTAESQVEQAVRQAGINQTITEVSIKIQAKIQIVAPFVREPVDIETKVPVVYMVLVGDVPQYFFDARGLPIYPPGWGLPGIVPPPATVPGMVPSPVQPPSPGGQP